jgi:hypothetical protein
VPAPPGHRTWKAWAADVAAAGEGQLPGQEEGAGGAEAAEAAPSRSAMLDLFQREVVALEAALFKRSDAPESDSEDEEAEKEEEQEGEGEAGRSKGEEGEGQRGAQGSEGPKLSRSSVREAGCVSVDFLLAGKVCLPLPMRTRGAAIG